MGTETAALVSNGTHQNSNGESNIHPQSYGTSTCASAAHLHQHLPDNHAGEESCRRPSFGGCVVDTDVIALSPHFNERQRRQRSFLNDTNGRQSSLLEEEEDDDGATYVELLKSYRPFRLYLLSYFVAHAGEWFTYVAAISATERILPESQTAVSILVVLRLIPNVLFAGIGGAIADATDRRWAMIALDLIGSIVVLSYLLAIRFQSIGLIYFVTFVQATVAAIYEPVRSSIVPLLVPEEEFLKKATTLSGLAWSLMAAVGASAGGLVASALGIQVCFKLDGLTYLLSAFLMYRVGGTWSVAPKSTSSTTPSSPSSTSSSLQPTSQPSLSPTTLLKTFFTMTLDGATYLRSEPFAIFVFLKSSGAIVFGAADVLNVSFSEQENDPSGNSRRLGIVFASVGIGCLVGPLVADRFTDMKRPRTLQAACVAAYGIIAAGYLGMARYDSFWGVCLFTMLRSSGSSIMWVDSNLLLQKFSSKEMLGRVLAVDFGLATLADAISAFCAGLLEDYLDFTPEDVSWCMGGLGVLVFLGWYSFHNKGYGVAGKPMLRDGEEEEDDGFEDLLGTDEEEEEEDSMGSTL